MKECPMKYPKEYTTDPYCNQSCAWFLPPVKSDKEGGCAITTLAIASLLQNTFTGCGVTPQELIKLVKEYIQASEKK